MVKECPKFGWADVMRAGRDRRTAALANLILHMTFSGNLGATVSSGAVNELKACRVN